MRGDPHDRDLVSGHAVAGFGLAATLISIWQRVATALLKIVVGTVAQLVIGAVISSTVLGVNEPWIKFLAGMEAIILTFLAGTELDPEVFKKSGRKQRPGVARFCSAFFRGGGWRKLVSKMVAWISGPKGFELCALYGDRGALLVGNNPQETYDRLMFT